MSKQIEIDARENKSGSPPRKKAAAAQQMQVFMREQLPMSAVDIKALIKEGRG